MQKIDINSLCDKFETNEMNDILKNCILPYINYFDLIERYQIDEKLRQKILKEQTVITENKREDGVETIYSVDGVYHREDGPAIITPDAKEWWYRGIRHRIVGPAIEYTNGDREWFVDGKRHRLSGPAVIKNNRKEWWQNNIKTRKDGPHVITADGMLLWFRGTQYRATSTDFYEDYYGYDRDETTDYHADEFYYYDEEESNHTN